MFNFNGPNPIVYDIECYPNCFLFGIRHIFTNEVKIFEISNRKDESKEMMSFVASYTSFWVGFNNLNYDYPLFDYYAREVHDKNLPQELKNNRLFHKSRKLIANTRSNIIYYANELKPQIDLYKIHHYDNVNKRTSLKYLEFGLKLNNIAELPFHFTTVLQSSQIDKLIEYLHNDLLATHKFYENSKPNIELRLELMEKFKFYCINFSDSKMGEMLTKKFYLEEVDLPENILNNINTKAGVIDFNDVIYPHIEFVSEEFNSLLTWFKSQKTTKTKGFFSNISFEDLAPLELYYKVHKKKSLQSSLNIVFKDFEFTFGTGGIHGAVNNFHFKKNDTHTLISADVTSMYPTSIIQYELAPRHLDLNAFIKVYRDKLYYPRVNEKAKPKNERNNSIVEGFKLALNSVFGKLNSEYSWVYDPLRFLQTTVNNQLLLAALAEKLMLCIPDSKLVMINTDGLEMIIPNEYLDKYYKICEEWEKWSRFNLEYDTYDEIYIRDVNNYSAKNKAGEIKRKGDYNYEIELHKNGSKLIVPTIVDEYLYDNANIDERLNYYLEKNIFLFFNVCKVKKNCNLHFIKNKSESLSLLNEVQRVTRYVCVKDSYNKSGILMKKLPPLDTLKGYRKTVIESESKVICVNNLDEVNFENLKKNINLDWYKKEIEKLIKIF